MVPVTCGADLARSCAANELNIGKQALHLQSQNVEVVLGRAEEHDQCHVVLRHLGVELACGITCISGARLSPAYAAPTIHAGTFVLPRDGRVIPAQIHTQNCFRSAFVSGPWPSALREHPAELGFNAPHEPPATSMPVNIAASIRSHGLLSDLTGFATVAGIWPRWRLQPWKAESFKSARTPELGAKTRGFMGLYLNPHEKAAVVVAVTPSRSTRVPSTSNSTSRTGLQVDIARGAEQPTVVRRRNADRRDRCHDAIRARVSDSLHCLLLRCADPPAERDAGICRDRLRIGVLRRAAVRGRGWFGCQLFSARIPQSRGTGAPVPRIHGHAPDP